MRICRLGLLVLLAAAACDQSGGDAATGRRVYAANCTGCHHPDPELEGVLGPPLAGSSRALIEARVVAGTYPPGYEPKRDTELMVALPFLGPQVDALAAYLAEPE